MTGERDALILPELFHLSEQDLPWLSELEKRVQVSPWQAQHFADSLEAGHDAWGARQGVLPQGFVLIMHDPYASHLLNIAVLPEAQGRGMGAFLLRHAMRRAAETGVGEMFLEVRPSNDKALALYQSFGFQEIARRKSYYSANRDNVREDALILRATLPVLEEA